MKRAITHVIVVLAVVGFPAVGGASSPSAAPAKTVCPSYRTNDQYPLRLCDKGDPVRDLQFGLQVTVAANLVIDGYFGPATQAAVRLFQERNGLAVDGLVGPRTWPAVTLNVLLTGQDTDGSGIIDPDEFFVSQQPPSTADCDSYAANNQYPLRMCDSGQAVRLMQFQLTASNPYLEVDGNFGPETEHAVRVFQDLSGLTIDGLVGPATWRTLTAGRISGTDSDGNGVIDPAEVTG